MVILLLLLLFVVIVVNQVVDDPSGNSFVQGEIGRDDKSLKVEHYKRTKEQDEAVGMFPPADATDSVIVEASGMSEEKGVWFLILL